jgi:serine/threonine protein phosphatase 1
MKTDPERFLSKQDINRIVKIADHFTGTEVEPVKTYAMTDIHGMDRALLLMLEIICRSDKKQQCRLVFMGDYVDRGPDPAATIAVVRLLEELMPPEMVICLKGNHEQMLIKEIQQYANMRYDDATRISFNSRGYKVPPPDVMGWLTDLRYRYEDEKHFYVHAGFNPQREIDEQLNSDMIWIRDQFLKYPGNYGKHVFHGHTPDTRLISLDWRTCCDGGAVFGGIMIAAEIDPGYERPISFFTLEERDRKIIDNRIFIA